MSSLAAVEKRYFENSFGMSGGYVLDFTNKNFAQFFQDTVNINIYNDKYNIHGDSKANRLRAFWEIEPDPFVGKVLSSMLDVWKFEQDKSGNSQPSPVYIECRKITHRLLGTYNKENNSEKDFLAQDFGDFQINTLDIDSSIITIIDSRIIEAKTCLKYDSALSVIILCGSVLEGILLAIAMRHPREFNQSKASPKDKQGNIKPLYEWTLANFIDVACELELLDVDVKKFCHVLRDFRNYIHPYQQMASNFTPDSNTAKICMKVLEAAVADVKKKKWN